MDLRYGDDINWIRAFAQELVGLQPDIVVTNPTSTMQPDIIMANGTSATTALHRETQTIPSGDHECHRFARQGSSAVHCS
jgi:hypothetical protein